MLGPQFIHVESLSFTAKKNNSLQSAQNAALEAERAFGHCPHILHPKKPVRVFGVMPTETVAKAKELVLKAKDPLGRKIRKDANIMISGVVSFPVPMPFLTPSDERVQLWLKKNIQFLKKKYGKHLSSILLHTEESHLHCHYFVLPPITEKGVLDMGLVHDGIKARSYVAKTGGSAKAKKRAYEEAMRAFQDEYYEHVSKICGLTREGPKRRRLTRSEWCKEKKTAERLAKAEMRVEQVRQAARAVIEKQFEIQNRIEKHNNELNHTHKNNEYHLELKL